MCQNHGDRGCRKGKKERSRWGRERAVVRAHEKGGECAHVCSHTCVHVKTWPLAAAGPLPGKPPSLQPRRTKSKETRFPRGGGRRAYPAPGQEGLPAGMELFILWFLLDLLCLVSHPVSIYNARTKAVQVQKRESWCAQVAKGGSPASAGSPGDCADLSGVGRRGPACSLSCPPPLCREQRP